MKYLLVLLILGHTLALFLRKHRLQHRLHSQCKTTNWPAALLENTLRVSSETPCSDSFLCRTWGQILNLAACKTKKITDILDSDMKLFYIQTVYKTEAQDEWAKLMYSLVEGGAMGDMDTKVKKGAFLIRMCVSVSKRYNAWADDRCPLDECEPYDSFLKKKDCLHTDQTQEELKNEMTENYRHYDQKYNGRRRR